MVLQKFVGILIALLLVSTTFMPAVAAQSDGQQDEKCAPTMETKLISDDGTVSTYTSTYKISDTKTRYFYIKKTIQILSNGTETGTVLVYELDANGNVIGDGFGKDSTYSIDSGGNVQIHIGPIDVEYLRSGGEIATGSFATWLAVAGIFSEGVAIVVAGAIAFVFIIASYYWTNNDGSMDLYIPYASLLLFPAAIIDPAPIPIPIMVKNQWTVLIL